MFIYENINSSHNFLQGILCLSLWANEYTSLTVHSIALEHCKLLQNWCKCTKIWQWRVNGNSPLNEESQDDTNLSTIMSNGIWVTATINVMKNSKMRNGKMVLHGELHGPAVATGTTVTSANSAVVAAADGPLLLLVNKLKLPWIPVETVILLIKYINEYSNTTFLCKI